MPAARADRLNRLITMTAVATAAGLLVAKFVAYLMSGSVAVLGALADSGLDLASSGLAFFAVRFAAQPPDENHRFGHQKAEAVSALLQCTLIGASATIVAIESVRRLIEPVPIERPGPAIIALGLASLVSLLLVIAQTMIVRRTGSLVVSADRSHYVGDIVANAGLLLAVWAAAAFGLSRIDGIAGLMAAGVLFWSVREVAAQALPQLMDEELPDEERAEIGRIILGEAGVQGFHNLRTRRAGSHRFIQVDIELPGEVPLAAAHRVATGTAAALKARFPGADVMVHQDIVEDPARQSREKETGTGRSALDTAKASS
jgi:ferrous-iron efflux pump FieF